MMPTGLSSTNSWLPSDPSISPFQSSTNQTLQLAMVPNFNDVTPLDGTSSSGFLDPLWSSTDRDLMARSLATEPSAVIRSIEPVVGAAIPVQMPPSTAAISRHTGKMPAPNERQLRIRRAIESALGGDDLSATVLNTVQCWHTSGECELSFEIWLRHTDWYTSTTAAQKSYGREKRLLTPPPMIRIVGPLAAQSSNFELEMAVIMGETGDEPSAESSRIDIVTNKTYFRGLHVSGPVKTKHCTFRLSMRPSTEPDAPKKPSFAAFDSKDVQIISKPSKKTAKARNTSSCLFAGSTIAMYNRINSQTVRTKYMAIDQGRLAARVGQWTAFSIHVLRRAEDANPDLKETLVTSNIPNGSLTVTYGSEIMLTDRMTGVSSERLIVRKVEKNEVIVDASGPVSQLQKMALARITSEGEVLYLSASPDGLDGNGVPMESPHPPPAQSPPESPARFKRKKARTSKYLGDDDELDEDGLTRKTVLSYEKPEQQLKASAEDPEKGPVHSVTDFMSWTVLGVGQPRESRITPARL